ncbi:uncharacterized protein LOC143853852 [Tasmannia lanceolata]|uniref:uncharacterized protein LOC143853852 n=1 Tax=Tasmannia lanceolata TaxID=3420 RepID=UPI004064A207
MSSAYHPQTDGQSEVLNRCLEQYLRAFSQENPKQWQASLLWAEYSYNTSFHTAIKMTPYEAVYGRPPRALPTYIMGSSKIEAADEELMQRDTILSQLKTNLLQTQSRMKSLADQKRTDKQFEVSAVAYKLKLPEHSRIHPVFHISLLKPYYGPTPYTLCELPSQSFNNQPLISPLAVLSTRTVLRDDFPVKQVLVQWRGLLPEDTSWKDETVFQQDYPHLDLEDKVSFQEGGNDINPNHSSIPEQEDNRAERVRNRPQWMRDYVEG